MLSVEDAPSTAAASAPSRLQSRIEQLIDKIAFELSQIGVLIQNTGLTEVQFAFFILIALIALPIAAAVANSADFITNAFQTVIPTLPAVIRELGGALSTKFFDMFLETILITFFVNLVNDFAKNYLIEIPFEYQALILSAVTYIIKSFAQLVNSPRLAQLVLALVVLLVQFLNLVAPFFNNVLLPVESSTTKAIRRLAASLEGLIPQIQSTASMSTSSLISILNSISAQIQTFASNVRHVA